MREILFRGKILGLTDWSYGYYAKSGENHFILLDTDSEDNYSIVDPETVGQYTGVCDKNGNKIFEGDIVRYEDYAVLEVGWGRLGWRNLGEGSEGGQDEVAMVHFWHKCKIVGNKWDNPELLEVKK